MKVLVISNTTHLLPYDRLREPFDQNGLELTTRRYLIPNQHYAQADLTLWWENGSMVTSGLTQQHDRIIVFFLCSTKNCTGRCQVGLQNYKVLTEIIQKQNPLAVLITSTCAAGNIHPAQSIQGQYLELFNSQVYTLRHLTGKYRHGHLANLHSVLLVIHAIKSPQDLGRTTLAMQQNYRSLELNRIPRPPRRRP